MYENTLSVERTTATKAFAHFTALYLAIIAFIAESYIVQSVVIGVLQIFAPQVLGYPWFAYGLAFASMYCVGFPVLLLITAFVKKTKPEKTTIGFGRWMKYLCMAIAAMYIGAFLGGIICDIIEMIPGFSISNASEDIANGLPEPVYIVMAVLVGPFVEEMIFRKIFIDRTCAYGEWRAIFASALCFGLFHGNFSQIFFAVLVGIVLGVVYVKTKKLWYTFAIHATINALSGVIVPHFSEKASGFYDAMESIDAENLDELVKSLGEYGTPLAISGLLGILIFAAVILGVIFFISEMKHINLKKSVCGLSAGKIGTAMWLNPGFLIFAALSVATMILEAVDIEQILIK